MSLHLAETLFRWLMLAYPVGFRRTHGLALFELFRDEAREARKTHGTFGVMTVFLRSAGDTLRSAPGAWRDRPASHSLEPEPHSSFGDRAGWMQHHASGVLQDFRIAIRHLRQAPAFTAVAVTTLALGIGTNTAVFSLMNAVLLRPLASRQPDRVVRIGARAATGGVAMRRFSYPDFTDYRERATTIEALSAVNLATILLSADNRTDQLLGEIASGGYHELLGAQASQGRLLSKADDAPAAAPVAVISDALWRRRFAGQPVVGREVLLNRRAYTIVGVAGPAVVGSFVGAPIDVWLPIETSGQALGANWRTDRSPHMLTPAHVHHRVRGDLRCSSGGVRATRCPCGTDGSDRRASPALIGRPAHACHISASERQRRGQACNPRPNRSGR
jgi:hypothetical protein